MQRWTKRLSFGNSKAMELKLIKHDGAFKDIAGQLKVSEAPERLSSALTERRGWSIDHGQVTHS